MKALNFIFAILLSSLSATTGQTEIGCFSTWATVTVNGTWSGFIWDNNEILLPIKSQHDQNGIYTPENCQQICYVCIITYTFNQSPLFSILY